MITQYHISTQRGRHNWQWDYFFKTKKEALVKVEQIKNEWDYIELMEEKFRSAGSKITFKLLFKQVGK